MEAVQHRHKEKGVIYTEISVICFVSVFFEQFSDHTKTSLFFFSSGACKMNKNVGIQFCGCTSLEETAGTAKEIGYL